MRLTSIPFLLVGALLLACGQSQEEAQQLADLQADLRQAGAAIDSLNNTLDSSNLLIDELRSRADSLQGVDDKLLESVQRLNKEVREWRNLYTEQKRKNEQLALEVERLKREKQGDQQTIARIRSEADDLNASLLDAHTNIRRQSDRIRQLETELIQARGSIVKLEKVQSTVHVLAATAQSLEQGGFVNVDRTMGRAFRKAYKLTGKLDLDDPQVLKLAVGETMALGGKLEAVVDRYGQLKEGRDYATSKQDGQMRISFTNAALAGADVAVVLEK
jgi:myosin heavy subunit